MHGPINMILTISISFETIGAISVYSVMAFSVDSEVLIYTTHTCFYIICWDSGNLISINTLQDLYTGLVR